MQLPCINVDWLPLLLGCVDQLRNPSSWLDTLTDSARESVIAQADYLRSILAASVTAPCVNPVVNVAIDCTNGLQFQTADGIWHVGTSMADICVCTTACLVQLPPPNPGGTAPDQHACNLAGYLATIFLQKALQDAHAALAAGNTVLQYFQQLAADIATGNPFLEVLVTVAQDLYPTVQAQPIADVAAVAGDASLWAEVTCIIYLCIKAKGYLDASNFSCVGTGLGAIVYPKTWVAPLLQNAWNNAGVQFMEKFEAPGGIDDVDCTDCGTAGTTAWFDWTSGNHGFVTVLGNPATNVTGTGWVGGYWTTASPPSMSIDIQGTPTSWHLDSVELVVTDPSSVAGTFPWTQRFCQLLDSGGTEIARAIFPTGAFPTATTVSANFGGTFTPHDVRIYWPGSTSSTGTPPIISSGCFHNPLGFSGGTTPCPNPPFTY